MPYCPKCDMEFVEGITVCSDCGGPLYESEEAAKAAQKQEKKENQENPTSAADGLTDEPERADNPPDAAASKQPSSCSRHNIPAPAVYVKKSDRYEDMKSSASAFLMMGCAAFAGAALCVAGILPVTGSMKLIFPGVLAVMGAICLAVFVQTRKSAAVMQKEAAEENTATEELISWFLSAHLAEELDRRLAEEAALAGDDLSEYTPEELSLKRYGLIQDYLITEKDLPDQTYVDLLCEEIYNRMVGQE